MSYKQQPIYGPDDKVRIRDTLKVGRVMFAGEDIDAVIRYAVQLWMHDGQCAFVICAERELENGN